MMKVIEKDARGLPDGSLNVGRVAHLVVSLGIILAIDKALKRVFMAAMIKLPSAFFVMFCIFSMLSILDVIRSVVATALLNFFEPAKTFIQRWLPLFYVLSLVVLPLAMKGIPASSGMKIGAILVGDWATIARKEKIEDVELELRKLEGAVEAIHENLVYLRSREAEMREVSEVTNARVAWFNIMSLTVCLVVSARQR